MVKIPGTKPGVPAIQMAIEDGININVTLLFAVDAYKAVLEAYIAGLEARVAKKVRRSTRSHRSRASSSAASTA